jgi:acetylornithine deacetylase/succinyl-diaminopimelate desuccinylase-like protein
MEHSMRKLLTLILLVACAAPLRAQAPTPRQLTKWQQLAHDIFKELIEINTEGSIGSTAQAAKAMAARLKAAGFPDSDVVVLENAPKKGNLVARLRAKNPVRKPILLLSHIDVVEAKPEDWTLPPFQFTEKADSFYARGVSDNKDDAAIDLALIIRLRTEGFQSDRDIIVAATTDEEGGGDNGVGWLIQNHPELIQAEYGLNEGGSGRVKEGKSLSHDIQLAEKKVANFRLEATNPGGHSSRPIKDNAITHLADALVKVGAFDFPVHLNDVTRAYFEKSAAIVEPEMGAAMRALVANPADAKAAATISTDPSYNSQLRTTCVATMLEGGHASNALPQRARATVNCRILPDEDPAEVQKTLVRVVDNPKVTVSPAGNARNTKIIPLPPELQTQIERVTAELWPGLPVIPTMGTGATDGSRLRNAGIPTFGVAGQFYGDSNAHGMNERIPQKAFYDSFEFMYRLVTNLSRTVVP